jgi:hypothetical protein
MPITFDVSDVARADAPPPTLHFTQARERQGGRAIVAAGGPERVVDGPVVPALVHAAHVAFAEHRPLVLSPDDVWFTVLQGLAAHVALHAEELRGRFVAHAGKVEIEIRRDDLAPGVDPPGDWATVPGEIAAKALEHAGDTARALRVELSTTDRHARVALDVALLDALQSYFSYSVRSLCGIPAVTLLGEPRDWATLVERGAALAGLGLDAWLAPLREVLSQMHAASTGRVDRDFWRALYKPEHFSGGDLVTGWINVLYPYARDAKAPRNVTLFLPRNLPQGPDPEASWMPRVASVVLKPSAFPSSLARAPFTWKLAHAERAMDLVAGHVGVGYDAATGAVAPRFGWWVAPRAAERAFVVHNPSPAGCSLMPRDRATLATLATAAAEAEGYADVELWLSQCDALASLDGLGALRALGNLSVSDCHRLTTLAPLAGLPALRHVSFMQCRGIADLRALATLDSLESVVVMHCPAARGIAAIANLPRLRRAVLWGFAGLPAHFQKNLTDEADVRALQAWLRDNPGV